MSVTNTLKIGILVTGELPHELEVIDGSMAELYRRFFARHGIDYQYRDFNTVQGEVPGSDDGCDGYLITGSAHGVYEDHNFLSPLFDFIRRCHAEKRKLVGICFGHQAVAAALGGEVVKSEAGWGLGAHVYQQTALTPWIDRERAHIRLLISHQDQVIKLPPDARNLLSSQFCPYAGFAVDNHIFTLQAHPEQTRRFSEKLIERRWEIAGENVASAALASLDAPRQEDIAARWIDQFYRL